jgi:hypothetical protein
MTEDLLQRAMRRQAERAPDPDRVRAALPRRAARRTRRRYGSLAGGLAAVAALAMFAVPVLLPDDVGAPQGDGFGAPGSSASTAASSGPAAPAAVDLRYKPTWLPAGLTERSRTVPTRPGGADDGPVRVWKRANTDSGFDMGGSRLEFAVVNTANGAERFGSAGEVVDINGRPGRLVGKADDGKTYIHWQIDPHTVILINNVEVGLSNADLLTMARSVQPDPTQLVVPARFGWLPTGMAPESAQLSGDSADAWRWEITAHSTGHGADPSATPDKRTKEGGEDPDRWLYARLGHTTDAPDGGDATVVGGRPARVVVRPVEGGPQMSIQRGWVVVDLASGLKLTVFGIVSTVSRDDLLATAAAVQVGAVENLGWLGAASR